MNVSCPECGSVYRLDPLKVPDGGARTRCRQCQTPFLVAVAETAAPGMVVEGARVTRQPLPAVPRTAAGGQDTLAPPASPAPAGQPVFGPQDPEVRARRLARALVSDVKVYQRDRWERSRAAGTLRRDFRDEIIKSWEEYMEQVGEIVAKRTPFFREALNDILADGERVF
jgi:predicted Zn finger-like uncharacterized protein